MTISQKERTVTFLSPLIVKIIFSIRRPILQVASSLVTIQSRENPVVHKKINAQEVVPKVDNYSLDQVRAKQKRTLIPVTEWEGYIESVDEEEFSVRMVNVRSKSVLPVDQATFSKNEVSEYDRSLLRKGAIVRWIIGRERLPTGKIRNVSELYFRRLPAYSEKDYRRAYEKVGTFLDLIVWENEAESR